jgi:transposase-like protein
MAKTNTTKRYTDEQKAEIFAFIEKYNEENGRGGQTAAIKKFKVTALTIYNWRKGSSKRGKAAVKQAKKKFRNPSKLIERLHIVTKEIEKAETALSKLQAEAKVLRKEIRLAID